MGVQGLSTFIDDNKDIFLTDHKLHNTRVVVDGSNLFHFLYYHYKISHQFGGDYDHFARKCKRFFNILKQCKVIPYIVFDGGYDPDDRKLPTVLERMNDRRKKVGLICAKGRGCVLPILSYETFRQVLVELNIHHVSCVFEADREIAVLAKKWKCPVLSNDSDFFVYGLDGGFVPLDYINLTLCVYNTKTEEETVLGKSYVPNDHEIIYIPVKYYNCDRFLKLFGKGDNSYVLPLFATVMGNDYVDYSLLYTFYAQLHAPKNPSNKTLNVKVSGRMASVLHWLTTTVDEMDALKTVLATVTTEKKEQTEQILRKSVTEYKEIGEFASFDLEKVLESDAEQKMGLFDENEKSVGSEGQCDSVSKEFEGVSELSDFYCRKLPMWFVKKMRNCEVNGGFLQNVTVVHRVIFNCQVEMLKEASSYVCSRNLRAVIYGIVLSPAKAGSLVEKPDRNSCVEEYDREGINMKKYYVRPAECLDGLERLPTLEEVFIMPLVDRKNLLIKAFGFLTELLDKEMTDTSKFFLLITSYWVKCAQPRVSEAHLSSLIIGVIMLHISALDWVNMKKSQGFSPFEPVLFQDIVHACETTQTRKLDFFRNHMEKYFNKPEHSSRFPRDNKVVHGFAQFQAVFLDALYLNQVLRQPVTLPSPSVILNGTFMYNLCRDLDGRVHPYNYLNDMLGSGTPLQKLFNRWKDLVVTLCKGSNFDGDKRCSSAAGLKTKSKQKAKKSKKANISTKENESTCHISEDEVESDATRLDLEVNCDVNNRFALLQLRE